MENRALRRIISSPFENFKITSYGIILYSIKSKKWIMVRRKESVEYMLFMRGKYEKSDIFTLVKGFTYEEVIKTKNMIDDPKLFISESKRVYKKFKISSYNTFLNSKDIIAKVINKLQNNRYSFHDLCWEWPKGMVEKDENGYECAIREFEEEVGIKLNQDSISSIMQLKPQYHNYPNTTIEIIFWFITIDTDFEIKPPSKNDIEVSDRRWMTDDEVIDVLTNKRSSILHSEPSIIHYSNIYRNCFEICVANM